MQRMRFGLASLALGVCVDLNAQAIEEPVTVNTRERPGYDAIGIPVGGLRLFPELQLGLRHDSNILATPDNEVSDRIVDYRPGVALRSDWTRHEFAVGADIDAARFEDNGNEDYTDTSIWTRGALDFSDARLSGFVRYQDAHEPRTSPDARRGVSPTEFAVWTATLGYDYQPARFFLHPRLRYRELEFDSIRTPAGAAIDNSDRDRSRTEIAVRAGFEVSPDYIVFSEASSTSLDYDRTPDNDGFDRNASGAELDVGALFRLTGKMFGEISVGYLEWSYDDSRFSDVNGSTFGADITWNITPLITLNIDGDQQIRATTVNGASGIDQTRFGIQADYELLRNLILSASADSREDEFQNIQRTDDIVGTSLGGRYLMNRYLSLDIGYRFDSRETSPAGAGDEYDIETLYVRINGQL